MQKTGPLKAVLFDLDDTLFDHRFSSRNSLVTIQQQYSCFQHITIDELERVHITLLEEIHLQVLRGMITLDEARIMRMQRLFAHFGEQIPISIAEEATKFTRQTYQSFRRVVPGAIALLEALRSRVKIGIVSNNMLVEQQEKLKHLGLKAYIDVLVVSEEAGFIKPAAEIFHIALARLQCKAEEAVMIGDAWQNDIVGARGAGIRAIWLNRAGMPCPDPTLATEITAFEPIEDVLALLSLPS